MATYTAKATTSSKASGTTLTTSSLSFTPGAFVLVGLAYDDAAGHPTSVTWGNRLLANRPLAATRNPGTYDIAMSVWVLPRVKRSTSHVITATWSSAIVERAMIVGEINGKNRIDEAAGNNDATSTGNPVTGTTATLFDADDFAIAYFASEGPSGDTAGTLQINDGGTWTTATGTQRVGTVGAPPASNVTLHAGWLQLTSASATQSRIQTATSRLWTSAAITFREAQDLRQAVTPSDVNAVELIFEDHTPALDPDKASYVYNQTTDEWEVFESSDMSTRIAHKVLSSGIWTAG